MTGESRSPFLRPLVIAAAVLVVYCVRRLGGDRGIVVSQFLMVAAWFVGGAVLTGFAQMALKKEFNWAENFIAVLVLSIIAALATLGLVKAGVIHL